MTEPRYVDVDEEGRSLTPQKFPGWTSPKGNIQRTMLNAVGRKRYKNRDEQSACNEVARQSLSLRQTGSPYPTEWIEFCCEWAAGKREKNEFVNLKGLLSFIKNDEAMNEWLEKNRSRYERTDEWDKLAD